MGNLNGIIKGFGQGLKQQKAERKSGKSFNIPFKRKYPTLSQFLPGINKGVTYGITSGSGVSKTQLTKDMFVHTPYDWNENNTNDKAQKVDYEIIYFALEESKKEFTDSFFRKELADRCGLFLNRNELVFESNYVLSDSIIERITTCEAEVAKILDRVEVVDNMYTPTEIYNHCIARAKEWGKMIRVQAHTKIVNGEEVKVDEYVYWKPHRPGLHIIVIVDHLNELSLESEVQGTRVVKLNKHETLGKWCDDYANKELRKRLNWTVVNVIQQSAESEAQQFNFKGTSIVSKVVPSLAGLGNNKEIVRGHYVMLGLFAPHRFEIKEYNGYNTDKLADYFRSVLLLKNRIGKSGIDCPMYHNGAVMEFKEMPDPKDPKGIKEINDMYDTIERIEADARTRNLSDQVKTK